MTEPSADDLSNVADKCTSFIEGLSPAERELFADVLAAAGIADASPEVEGFGPSVASGTHLAILANGPAIDNPLPGTSNERHRSGLDSIQKILDILHSTTASV